MKKKSQYKILEVIGLGSFGKVFAALDLQSQELIALKELGKQQLSTSDFLRELFCLTTLNHQNIVACRGLEHHKNRRYLIMDYCEGGTLRNLLLSGKQLGLLQCLDIILQILAALEFAHQKNVIHRDIKPENILLKINHGGWDALLSDFGISTIASKLTTDSEGLTGSPAYMAPEQFYGKFSIHSDLYAVGILLYELVVGERPFNGTPKNLLKAHLSEPVNFPDSIPFLIRNIILIALRKSPNQRFDSAKNMSRDLGLVAKILKNENLVQPLLFVADQQEVRDIEITDQGFIPEPIDHFFALNESSYLACDLSFQQQQQLNSRLQIIASRSLKIYPETKIIDLQIIRQSYVLIQRLGSDQQLIYFNFATGQSSQFSVSTAHLCWCLREWRGREHLILSYYSRVDQTINCQLFNTSNFQELRAFAIIANLDSALWNLEPFQILNFNRYYGIACYRDYHNRKTNLQVFNYRGDWIANFLLKTAIARIISNEADDQLLLATDFNLKRSVLIINLKRFQVERKSLAIDPVFIISRQQYFILADKRGRFLIYDLDENIFTQHKLNLPVDSEVRAIACTQNLELIATTWSQKRNQGSILKGKFINKLANKE